MLEGVVGENQGDPCKGGGGIRHPRWWQKKLRPKRKLFYQNSKPNYCENLRRKKYCEYLGWVAPLERGVAK